ncbi:39S ribosomal protein L44, mitochondrial-like [Portunus trituberculatus]|uniref:39S ribosomal protein L44, mitochondrial-like n=1 Tax=Portunus trituberculatus TaxID=210409 RepID=UPI001E1CC7E1|nr:39S ribosomal protein L44, mitochondrial-like [Portunus trituberculatus]
MAAVITGARLLLRSSCSATINRGISSSARVFGIKSRWVAPMYRTLKHRHTRMKSLGLLPSSKRSEFIEWNYDAELYAFGKRLQEEFDGDALREALTDASYITKEMQRQQELGVSDPGLAMSNNKELAAKGETLITQYCFGYLRAALPLLPEEGISALVDYLLSEDVMSAVGYGIGLRDLILCEEHPPSSSTMARCFHAVVGALSVSSPALQCQAFVRDFVVAQLVGKDIDAIWKVENPMGVLADILHQSGQGEPEPRLIFQSGQETLQAVYHVGVYSDKKFMGSGYGETVETAVKEAAHDVLRKLFQITDSANPLPFGKDADVLPLKTEASVSLDNWSIDKTKNIISC